MKRRDFLKRAAIPATLAAVDHALADTGNAGRGTARSDGKTAMLPQRDYGKTGVKLSILGFGGYMLNGMEPEAANRFVVEAIEHGVNYFDVAPTYGNAEALLAPGLEPHRKDVFLACKTTQRKADAAETELNASLKRLRTDHFDLYQLHGLRDVKKDVDAAFAKGGAMETFIKAKKTGQVRFLGFSAHSVEAALTAIDRYDFDSILFPVNFACAMKGDFGPQVIERAKAKGAAILAIKALAREPRPKNDPDRKKHPNCWYQPISDPDEADLALRFALSQPVTSVVPPADASLFRMAIRLAMAARPITSAETKRLASLAAKLKPLFKKA